MKTSKPSGKSSHSSNRHSNNNTPNVFRKNSKPFFGGSAQQESFFKPPVEAKPAPSESNDASTVEPEATTAQEVTTQPVEKETQEDTTVENSQETTTTTNNTQEATTENSTDELVNQQIEQEETTVEVAPQQQEVQNTDTTLTETGTNKNQANLPPVNPAAGATGEVPTNETAQEQVEQEVALPTENTKVYTESLASQSPINFIKAIKKAEADIAQAKTNEKQSLQEALPEIEQPTGLPRKEKFKQEKITDKANKTSAKIQQDKTEVPNTDVKGKKEGKKIPVKASQPPSMAARMLRNLSRLGRTGDEGARKNQIKRGINNLPTSENVNTNLGSRPSVDLSGQANPQQNEANAQKSKQAVTKEQQKNVAESKIYKGENDIYPNIEKEKLSPNVTLSEISATTPLQEEIPKIPGNVATAFNAGAQDNLNQQLAPELAKQEAAYQKMEVDQEQEKQKTDAQIEAETARVKTEQETAQQKAKAEVNTHRQSWRAETEAVKQEYSTKSSAEKAKIDGQINEKVQATDKEVAQEYQKAETTSKQEVRKSKAKAAKIKRDAEAKSKEKSWWDRAVDAVSNFFDRIKQSLNNIFDRLRKFVKKIIETAKRAANKFIDMARNAIVSMIKTFGSVLKTLVNIALAAFPKLRDKFNALIDRAVNVAVTLVNKLAETLKKAVNALLDALGAVLDTILAAYQAFYNLLLDGLKAITVGFIKIARGLTNLVKSAFEMPPSFMGQLSEEFLGMDVTQPLPFERSTPYAQPAGSSNNVQSSNAIASYVNKGTYNADDFVVNPVASGMELPDAIMSQLQLLSENGELEFGNSNVETMQHLQQSATNTDVASSGDTTNVTESSGGMQLPPEYYGNTRAQIDWFIKEQGSQSEKEIPDAAPDKKAANQNEIPQGMRVLEPLTAGDRFYYLRSQMWAAIQKKWQQNKAKYITIGSLIVLAIAAAAVATGGAIFSLIPPALQIFAAYMAGQALLKAGGFFSTYMKDGWAGNIVKAGAALARAIGILLVELVFILLFDMAALLKVLKSGVKGSLKMAATGAKNTAMALGTGLKASGKGLIKTGSKVVTGIKGVGRGVGKGAKNLDEFAKRMLKKATFKGFKFKRKGFRFYLYGHVNPWVLLATGEIKEVKTKGGVKVGQKGKFVTKEGDEVVEGILIGGKNSKNSFVKSIKNTDEGIKEFKRLSKEIKKSADKTANIINKGVPRNPMFRKNFFSALEKQGIKLSENAKKFLAVHHIVPNFLKKNPKLHDLLKNLGHDIDEVINAIGLPRVDISLLDDTIKSLDKALQNAKNADEINELVDIINNIKAPLKLDDTVDIAKLKNILEELENFKTSAIHAIDSYHPNTNIKIELKLNKYLESYEDLVSDQIKAGVKKSVAESRALEVVGKKVNNYIQGFITSLTDGSTKILK